VDEVRDLDDRLLGERGIVGARRGLREFRGPAEPLVVGDQPRQLGDAASGRLGEARRTSASARTSGLPPSPRSAATSVTSSPTVGAANQLHWKAHIDRDQAFQAAGARD
jgi:hypothetical protein